MKRNTLVLGVMIVGIALLLWSGWHNLRQRRIAMQLAEANHVVLTPAQPSQSAQGDDSEDVDPGAKLRGKTAPAFTLSTLDGKKVSLADYKGRPVLLNFWATWCAPCKIEMPWFEELRKQYAGQGFEILGLTADVDAGKDVIGKTAKQVGVTYPILLTTDKVQDAYGGIEYLPMSFYVDRDGKVIEATAGLSSKNEIEENIKKTIASGATTAMKGGE
ncbi:MAG: TlpA disulfide reductase family protein [Edaphobacter sp.]|uniref:TlpA family protein disulfide reductase n=1 Tax=Edaphobacter sp. TaxID=1934404 RepID=UPI0029817427|nr:TlpA disulfide reductase family protein [Edaphobacter sp.]MDW5266538.1 TlpA disulfide reductase family protein [Edaphobacter sp.]